MSDSNFADALNGQVANEFAAHQQYVAIAVYYDAETLPRLAAFFFRQAVEERNHAMMITQYLLDADLAKFRLDELERLRDRSSDHGRQSVIRLAFRRGLRHY